MTSVKTVLGAPTATKDINALVCLRIVIKDGKFSYGINERSLGFRWFFSFLLFTYYRVSVESEKPVVFLLDEPASNLHSKAQNQLLESFPKIAKGINQIIYSTHSHYLINPDWLDQAYIVSNSAIDYEKVDEIPDNLNQKTSISAQKYRNFVGSNPDKLTYFQPVLDKLQIVPSRIDLIRPSVLVEGKSDYLIIEYVRRVLNKSKSKIHVVPTRGATNMDDLIGLFLGWGIPFALCLDDDPEGVSQKKRYIKEWGLSDSLVATLVDVSPELAGKEISGMLDNDDFDMIKSHFGIEKKPSKSQIQLYFSEMLAKKAEIKLSEKLIQKVSAFEEFFERRMNLMN